MYRYLLFLFVFLLLNSILSAQNHMDIMTTMTGDFNYAKLGWAMTTLDWNGDGFDDLVINESQWSPNGFTPHPPPFPYGKQYVYFGGPTFDNVPDMEIPGHHEIEFGHTSSMCNAGHMNNDQYDDLALFRATMYEDNDDQHYDLQLCVYYGSAVPDTIPDYVLTFPREVWDNTYSYVRSLGDVNQDGYDDIGYILNKNIFPYQCKFGIIYGGSMNNTDFQEISNIQDIAYISGVGDINADSISDFSLGYGYGDWQNPFYKIVLYYGNSSGIYSDSLIIANSSNSRPPFSYPAGDVNGDGYADFVSDFTSSSAKLFFGCPNFDATTYVSISPPYFGDAGGEGFGHGDVNGNGTDDLLGTFCTQGTGFGDAYLWMGGNTMNGGEDLHISAPAGATMDLFGYCLTMGDYNGDGYCDAAISAPFDYSGGPYPGKVFIYAGNPELDDPTPILDDTETPAISKLQLYPNPLQPSQSSLNVRFPQSMTPLPPLSRGDSEESARGDSEESARGNREVSPLDKGGRGVYSSTFEIYNIRGQKVKSFVISVEQAKSGSASFNLNDLSSGVYVCVFSNGNMQHKAKVTVIR